MHTAVIVCALGCFRMVAVSWYQLFSLKSYHNTLNVAVKSSRAKASNVHVSIFFKSVALLVVSESPLTDKRLPMYRH